MLKFNVLTIFPEMFDSYCNASICKRAIESRKIEFALHNFRDYTLDKHRRVDDAPFGGGAGMLIAPQSVFDCFDAIKETQQGKKSRECVYVCIRNSILSGDGCAVGGI